MANPTLDQPIFDEPVFQEGKVTPDPKSFRISHPSDDATYAKLGNLLETQTCAFPDSRANPDGLYLFETAFGAAGEKYAQQIRQAGEINFHAVGDTGSVTVSKYSNELRVSDAMVQDFSSTSTSQQPAFFYHLGDLVYNFGEAKYYYDEFYEPFRNYPRPIFAIPGNHDSFIVPGTQSANTPLDIFMRNFCATQFELTPEAYSLHRTSITQPGVYFTLDAPFVRIIGLFSNALEDPGVISSEKGRWKNVTDVQLDFLRAQLTKIKKESYDGAVILAMHHPPFVYAANDHASGDHGCSLNMLHDIDTICGECGVYPHAVLSGHAHNYQRFTRAITFDNQEIEVPFIVAGGGGHNVNRLMKSASAEPAFGADMTYVDVDPAVKSTQLVLEKYDDQNYGYLLVNVTAKQLKIAYHNTSTDKHQQTRFDLVTIDLATHRRVAN
jgi:hypothetical protein